MYTKVPLKVKKKPHQIAPSYEILLNVSSILLFLFSAMVFDKLMLVRT